MIPSRSESSVKFVHLIHDNMKFTFRSQRLLFRRINDWVSALTFNFPSKQIGQTFIETLVFGISLTRKIAKQLSNNESFRRNSIQLIDLFVVFITYIQKFISGLLTNQVIVNLLELQYIGIEAIWIIDVNNPNGLYNFNFTW